MSLKETRWVHPVGRHCGWLLWDLVPCVLLTFKVCSIFGKPEKMLPQGFQHNTLERGVFTALPKYKEVQQEKTPYFYVQRAEGSATSLPPVQ